MQPPKTRAETSYEYPAVNSARPTSYHGLKWFRPSEMIFPTGIKPCFIRPFNKKRYSYLCMHNFRAGIMASFREVFDTYRWNTVRDQILSKTASDVEKVLSVKTKKTLDDFMALVSPAATNYLEEMATLSHALTQKRFGKTIQLYTPLYVSNECHNLCTYCAFSYDNKIKRIILDENQIMREISSLKEMGFDHILIVTGEANLSAGMDYFRKILPLIRPHFSHISFEVQPMEQSEYEALITLGVNTVMIYQETYHEEHYKKFHPGGKKANFNFRLETPDRLGRAGIYKTGLGVLLGLDDWRVDSFFCAAHIDYLERQYWQTKYSVSFPRLRPIVLASPSSGNGNARPFSKSFETGISDREMVQLICAYRIFNEEVELSLSTRESAKFRDNIVKLGITTMSAGSKTNPGGYAATPDSLGQFEISDDRLPAEISQMLKRQGYEPVWKDWDRAYQPIKK